MEKECSPGSTIPNLRASSTAVAGFFSDAALAARCAFWR